jgi:carotenoid cleavage dioxygenase-like enzyme
MSEEEGVLKREEEEARELQQVDGEIPPTLQGAPLSSSMRG